MNTTIDPLNSLDSSLEDWETESVLSQSIQSIPRPTFISNLADLEDGIIKVGTTGFACQLCGKVLKNRASFKKHWMGSGCKKARYNSPENVFLENAKEVSERYQTISILMRTPDIYPLNQKRRDEYSLLVLIRKTIKLYEGFIDNAEFTPAFEALHILQKNVLNSTYDM